MIIQHHENFWTIDALMNKGGVEMGARISIARLKDETLWIHAPFAISKEEESALRALGTLSHIVVPNTFHFSEVGDFARLFPDATVWAPAQLKEKLSSVPHQTLNELPTAWREDLDGLLFDAALGVHEWVFCHRASGTLMLTDLSFNTPRPNNASGRIGSRIFDIGHGLGPSRLMRFLIRAADHKRARTLIDTILSWNFERITVAHGAVLESEGKRVFRRAFSWLR